MHHLAIRVVLGLLVDAIERVERGLVARIVAEAALQLDGIVVGDVLGARCDVGEIDLDRDVRARLFELLLELVDARLEEA